MEQVWTEPKPLKVAIIREEYVALTDDLESAVLLNQLIYWTERTYDFDKMVLEEKEAMEREGESVSIEPSFGWFFKKPTDLLEETMLRCSETSIRRKIKNLIDAGWVEERKNPHSNWDKKRQFRCRLSKIQGDLLKLGYCLPGFTMPQNPQKTRMVSPAHSNDQNDRSIDQISCSNDQNDRSLNRDYIKIINNISSSSEGEGGFSDFEEEDEEGYFKREGEGELTVQAIEVWNKHVQPYLVKDMPLHLTTTRLEALRSFLKDFCHNDLTLWFSYCQKIADTPFLLGKGEKGWKITFERALNPDQAVKVLEGQYFSKEGGEEVPTSLEKESLSPTNISLEDIKTRCNPEYQQSWGRICERLLQTIGAPKFKSWIAPLTLGGLNGSVALIEAPTRFFKETVEREYKSLLEAAIKSVLPHIESIELQVR